MKKHYQYVMLCHLFYEDGLDEFLAKLKKVENEDRLLLFNLHRNVADKYKETVKRNFPGCLIFTFPDKGRDIGAKLFLLNVCFSLGISASYAILLHDKKSPHLSNGKQWSEELLQILKRDNIEKKIPQIFTANPDAGIIGSSNFIKDEYDKQRKKFNCTSNRQIKELLSKYRIRLSDYKFVAGSIFVMRYDALKAFFQEPGRSVTGVIADMEEGNALDFSRGTYIHAWERLLPWIATSQGYKIYVL
jgi:lipopolysaccharide biosynthesis protein